MFLVSQKKIKRKNILIFKGKPWPNSSILVIDKNNCVYPKLWKTDLYDCGIHVCITSYEADVPNHMEVWEMLREEK